MSFKIPNDADAAYGPSSPLASPDSRDFDILAAAANTDGVISGCTVTAQGSPNMTVAVAAGVVQIAQSQVTVTAGNVTITTANVTNPRFDLICVDAAGNKSAVAGSAAATPTFPTIPLYSVVIAAVYVPANDTTIGSDQIVDKSTLVQMTNVEPLIRGLQEMRRVNGRELQHWKSALGGRKTRPANILSLGDSMGEGYGQSSDYLRWNWQLNDSLQQMYRTGGRPFIPARRAFTGGAFPSLANPDGKNAWTLTNLGNTSDFGWGIGSRAAWLAQASGSTATITVDCDRFYLFFTRTSGTATANISIDAGTTFATTPTFSTTMAPGLSGQIYDSGPLTLGTHTITVTAASGVVILDGILPFYTDTNIGVHVWDSAHSGVTAKYFDPTSTVDTRSSPLSVTKWWLDYLIQPTNVTSGSDGVGNTTTTFTAATGAFTALDIDEPIWNQNDSTTLIPHGTRIQAIGSGTSVTLNKAVPSGTSVPWVVNRATFTDIVTTNGSTGVSSATANFKPWDEGKYVKLSAGGFAATTKAVWIKRYVSATQVELNVAATASTTGTSMRINNRKLYPVEPDLLLLEFGFNDSKYGLTSSYYQTSLQNIVQGVIDRGNLEYTPSVCLLGLWAPALIITWQDLNATGTSGSAVINSTSGGDFGYYDATGNLVTDLVGKTVTGTGISGQTVLSVQTPSQLTLSANLSANLADGSFAVLNRTMQDFVWKRFRAAMKSIATSQTWAFYDLYTIGGYIGSTDPQNLTYDLIHPNDRGAQIIADELNISFGGLPKVASIPQGVIDAKGDIIVGSAADVAGKLPAGLDGQMPTYASGSTLGILPMDAAAAAAIGQIVPVIGGTTAQIIGLPAATVSTATNADDNENAWLNFATSTTQFNAVGIVSAAFTVTRAGRLPCLSAYIKTDPSLITSVAYAIGLSSASLDVASAVVPAAAVQGAYFLYNSTAHGTAFWRTVTSGGTITSNTTPTAIAANTSYRLRIVVRGVRGVSVSAIDFYINDVLVATHTTNLPVFSTPLGYGTRVEALAGAAARNLKVARVGLSGP